MENKKAIPASLNPSSARGSGAGHDSRPRCHSRDDCQ